MAADFQELMSRYTPKLNNCFFLYFRWRIKLVNEVKIKLMNLSIRPVALTDFDQWLPLWDGYNAFYGRSGETVLPQEITQTTWERFFDESEPVFALVAERDGKLVGLTHYLFHRSTTQIKPVCYLQDLFTDHSMRGHGIGRALINGVYECAQLAGSSRVYWLTHNTNSTAMMLYDKVADNSGFVVYRKVF
jgi:GNAT superfamily N-acetyltransferase